MSGLVLRLAGPLQSWGEHSAFADRDTTSFPTRSGLVGMFAAAMGLARGESLTRFTDLRLTVRVDAPGVPLTDFQTVGGGLAPARTVPIADGKHRPGDTGTLVIRRRYLSDAVFTVAITGPDALVDQVGEKLLHPRWQPYLGRRSCPPDQPFVLRRQVEDPERDLQERVPLPHRPRFIPAANGTVEVDLLTETETETETAQDNAAVTELADVPVSFASLDRRYERRSVYRQVVSLNASLVQSPGRNYREALFRYMRGAS